ELLRLPLCGGVRDVDEAAHARLGAAEAGEQRLADGEDGGCGGALGQGRGGSGLDGRDGGEPAASGSGEAAVGDEEAVGLERRRHGGGRRGCSPADAGVGGFRGITDVWKTGRGK
ncbi:unnamed protein product, partial [Urochloa humidicola]